MCGGKGEGRVSLEERHFRNLDKFEGNKEGWNGWVFNLNTQVAGVNAEVSEKMEKVLTAEKMWRQWKAWGRCGDKVWRRGLSGVGWVNQGRGQHGG